MGGRRTENRQCLTPLMNRGEGCRLSHHRLLCKRLANSSTGDGYMNLARSLRAIFHAKVSQWPLSGGRAFEAWGHVIRSNLIVES